MQINAKHLGKMFIRRHFETFLLFIPGFRIWDLKQIVSNGDNLHEMLNPDLLENMKNITNLSSAKYSQRVVNVKEIMLLL